MRALGHTNFYRRSLYNRFERERCTLGWIERFGWQDEEDAERERRGGAGISVSASRRPAVPASSSVPGSAGALACMDAKASGHDADPHTSPDDRPPHAGGTGAPGNAGALACMDAKASRRDADPHTSPDDRTRHAGGTGVAGEGACAPESDFDEFKEWLKQVSPSMKWDFRHQVYIYKRLRRVTEGECKRLMIFLPPRHGKSELVTIR